MRRVDEDDDGEDEEGGEEWELANGIASRGLLTVSTMSVQRD